MFSCVSDMEVRSPLGNRIESSESNPPAFNSPCPFHSSDFLPFMANNFVLNFPGTQTKDMVEGGGEGLPKSFREGRTQKQKLIAVSGFGQTLRIPFCSSKKVSAM